jgi:glutamine amidotransferase
VSRVAVVDSGGANLRSLEVALQRLGAEVLVTSDAATIRASPRVILPGVGSARDAMARLTAAGLDTVIPTLRRPVLGICLGMQLLFERSEEGGAACLGIVPGTVRRLQARPGLTVPHMGWNTIETLRPHPLFAGLGDGTYFYFVHSYAAPASATTIARTTHGSGFAAAVARDNFVGVQFHPERSAASGARLLGNFLGMEPCD